MQINQYKKTYIPVGLFVLVFMLLVSFFVAAGERGEQVNGLLARKNQILFPASQNSNLPFSYGESPKKIIERIDKSLERSYFSYWMEYGFSWWVWWLVAFILLPGVLMMSARLLTKANSVVNNLRKMPDFQRYLLIISSLILVTLVLLTLKFV